MLHTRWDKVYLFGPRPREYECIYAKIVCQDDDYDENAVVIMQNRAGVRISKNHISWIIKPTRWNCKLHAAKPPASRFQQIAHKTPLGYQVPSAHPQSAPRHTLRATSTTAPWGCITHLRRRRRRIRASLECLCVWRSKKKNDYIIFSSLVGMFVRRG